ncbi:hypothetical protein C8R44DRAFT_871518 [Mycena epipterygia]|nr:hypothetical protein C8R44DRAFT_871518 [Mycena epipterygia]
MTTTARSLLSFLPSSRLTIYPTILFMVDDKYIGLPRHWDKHGNHENGGRSQLRVQCGQQLTALQGLTTSADGTSATDNHSYFNNPVWWAGMSALIVEEVANFAAYTFAPPVMVSPLRVPSVIIGCVFIFINYNSRLWSLSFDPKAILASFLLQERLGHLGRVGCALCLLGSSIIVLHAPEDQARETVTQFLDYAVQPGISSSTNLW